jgi:uncharacterized membrane protein YjgN (DUF898 family)
MSLIFTKIFRLLWFIYFICLIFLDRDNPTVKIGLIISILLLMIITIFRSLESKKEWSEIISDMEESES